MRPAPAPATSAPRRAAISVTAPPPAAPVGPPSSLVKVADRDRPRCAACASTQVTDLAMTLTDGTPVRFHACRRCEHRSWRHGNQVLPVESVLAKATKRK